MKKLLAKIALLGVLIAPLAAALPTQAASITVGNDTAVRTMVDTFSNFTIVDTNHPVSATGTLSGFGYFASNQNPFRFVLVDSSSTVQWVSDQITPPGTGVQTYTPTSPALVQTGWNLGVYFSATGTIPFEQTGAAAQYTLNGSGLPTVGGVLSIAGNDARTYSFEATGDTGTTSGGGTGQQICTPINLTSGITTQTAGFTTTNPQADPLNPNLYSGAGTWANSALANTAGLIPGSWVDPTTNSNFASSSAMWVSTVSAHPGDTANGGQGLGTQDQWRLFKTDFVIPSGATVSPVTLYFTADNAVTVYLNGSSIANTPTVDTFGSVPSTLDTVFSNVYSVNFTPVAGQTNTLAFVVRNSAFDTSINPTGLLYNAQSQYCVSSPGTPGMVSVTIIKYVNGQPATASSTNSTSFPMNATWSAANIGSGSGSYPLGPAGFNNINPYQATTAVMTSGASYGTSEDTSQTKIVGVACASSTPYRLMGYTVGDTLAAAAAATPTTTAPNLTNITSNKFIIVWNVSCGKQGGGDHNGKGDDNNGNGSHNGNGGGNNQPGDDNGQHGSGKGGSGQDSPGSNNGTGGNSGHGDNAPVTPQNPQGQNGGNGNGNQLGGKNDN